MRWGIGGSRGTYFAISGVGVVGVESFVFSSTQQELCSELTYLTDFGAVHLHGPPPMCTTPPTPSASILNFTAMFRFCLDYNTRVPPPSHPMQDMRHLSPRLKKSSVFLLFRRHLTVFMTDLRWWRALLGQFCSRGKQRISGSTHPF